MSLGQREQPKISEEGIWPSAVIAKASTLTRTSSTVSTVAATTPMTQLVPTFETMGHQHVAVVTDENRVIGMVTESDIVIGLHRRHVERFAPLYRAK
jgi:CBS-domain-containing membrane protein